MNVFAAYHGPIIICRFILNLRQVQSGGASCSSGSNKSISLRFVGNVGQSLQFGSDDTDLEEINGRSTRADDCGIRASGNGDVEEDEAGRNINEAVLVDAADCRMQDHEFTRHEALKLEA